MQEVSKNHMADLSIILYINTFYPVFGGAQNQAGLLATQLKKEHYNIRILTRKLKDTSRRDMHAGIEIIRLTCFGWRFLRAVSFFFSSIFFFALKRKTFDVIQAFQMDSNAITACIAGFFLRKKVFVRIAGSGITGELARQSSLIGRLRFSLIRLMTHGFIVLNSESQNDLLSRGIDKKRICLLGNGVDTEHLLPADKETKTKIKKELQISQDFVILFSGRFCFPKRLDILIDAWKSLKADKSLLILLGDGPMKQSLIKKIADEKIANVLMTFSETPSLFYQICNICVIPTEAEGLSNVLLESMAHANIVIASHIPGISDVIENGHNGFLIENNADRRRPRSRRG